MTGNLDGARNPVAVAVARLRELAATDPQPDPAPASLAGAGPVEPHPYVEGVTSGRCTSCGRHEGATAAGARLHARPAPKTTTLPARPTPGRLPAMP
jgi:hypothetical protein